MPYKSQKQAAYMHIHHPDIAARWDKEYGVKPKRKRVSKVLHAIPTSYGWLIRA